MDTKRFPLRTILTVTTGRLLTRARGTNDNGIGDLYEILNWMTEDSVFTHQLGRFSDECKPWLLRWFPELAKVKTDSLDAMFKGASKLPKGDTEKLILLWLDTIRRQCKLKASYDVCHIPRDDHDKIHPYDELVIVRGKDEGIVIVEPGDDPNG